MKHFLLVALLSGCIRPDSMQWSQTYTGCKVDDILKVCHCDTCAAYGLCEKGYFYPNKPEEK